MKKMKTKDYTVHGTQYTVNVQIHSKKYTCLAFKEELQGTGTEISASFAKIVAFRFNLSWFIFFCRHVYLSTQFFPHFRTKVGKFNPVSLIRIDCTCVFYDGVGLVLFIG